MKVLKFGGTSVGSGKNILKVINILENYAKKDNVICVVSAVGGVTDKLLEAGFLAKNKDKNYATKFEAIKKIHFSILSEIILEPNKSILNTLEKTLQELKS
ncbi:MAG: bifunctional aspartate kinase/homoserine dehydrogenase I, partial [Oceanihabitans sp.]